MINWTLFQPRNLFVVAIMAIIAYVIFNHFSSATAAGSN